MLSRHLHRLLAVLAWVCGGAIALLLLSAAALMLIGNTQAGQRLLANATHSLTGGQVQLQGLSGRFPDNLRVQELLLSDPQGPWLRASDVHLDWFPLGLLRDRIRIRDIDAEQAAVLRRPAYGSHPSGPSAAPKRGGFSLPMALQIDQLRLQRLMLGANLAGSDVTLRLQAAVTYRSLDRAGLQLSVQRLDAVPATYLVTADITPRRVGVQLDLEEQANGPLANILQVPALGALSVHLLMEGPRTALKTRLDAHAGPLSASASGTLNLPARAAELTASVKAAAMRPRAGLAWDAVSLQVQAHGVLTAPTTSAQLVLSGLKYQAMAFDRLTAQLQGVGQGLSLQAQLAGLALPAPLGDLLRHAPLVLQGQFRLAGTSQLAMDMTVTHPLLQAEAHYALDLPGRRGSSAQPVSFKATVPNLLPWTSLVALPLQGRGTLQGQLQPLSSGQQLSLTAALAVSGGGKPWATLLAGRSNLAAQLSFDRDALRLTRATLTAPHLALSARGEDHAGALNIDWHLTRADLAALDPAASGALRAEGHVQGSLPRLSLSGSADARLSMHQANGALHATLQASDLPQRANGQLRLSGTLDDAPVALQASLQRAANGALSMQIGQGSWKSAHISGVLRLDGDIRTPQAHLTLSVPRLADVDPMLGSALTGRLTAQLDMQGSSARHRALVSMDGQDIALGSVQLRTLTARGTIEQPLRAPQLAMQVEATGTLGGIAATLALNANGAPARLQLTTHAAIGGGVQTATQLEAQAIWLQARRQLQLTSLDAHYRDQMLRLLTPALLSFNGGISVNRLRLGVPPAIVQVSGQITPRLTLRATVRRLSPAALGIFLPEFRGLQPRGEARADLVLQGSLSNPTGTLSFTANGLHSASAGVRGLPDASLTLNATLAARTASLQLALEGGPQMQLHADGRLPLDRTVPLALQVRGNVDLAFANAVLEASGQRALGQLGVQAQLSGTWASPQVRGQLTISKGELQDFSRGLRLSGIAATLQADGPELTLTHLTAQAGSGTISATGKINVAAHGMPVELTVNARHAQALRSDLLTADVDMALQLSGDLLDEKLSATGSVRVNKATINIPNAMPPAVAVLHVVRPGQQLTAPPPPKPLLAKMDLTVNAPTGIFIRGRGLTAQLGGTLHVVGDSSAPTVTGGFDLIHGTFDVAGTTLNFTSGRVGFTGSGLRNRIDPTLNLVAASYSGSYQVTLSITGFADAPMFTLSSSPPLPQEEILARLLFGGPASQLTTLQIASVGAALVTLSGAGGGGGFNPLNTVQQALGLNRLTVSSASSTAGANSAGGTAAQNNTGAIIEAGRYISNRVYVGARQSTTGTTQAQVQIDLTRSWKLQTTISTGGGPVQGAVTPQNDPGSSVGMRYQFEY
ncbi:MAG TPA: translocation/assembly module TamB domain-containing protein [Steroidobacteraceae bacterium]|jgi:translocation and assembly module TamB|nr:translocation/assembly module TamB domain-containing protein [Steroidobacteraceae bacterium]